MRIETICRNRAHSNRPTNVMFGVFVGCRYIIR